MKAALRHALLALAALVAMPAWVHADESVKLRLALDGEGRLYLTTEPADFAPPPLLHAPQPTPGRWHPAFSPGPASVAIDLKPLSDSTPCLYRPALSPLAGSSIADCDPVAYAGLPGAVSGGSAVLGFDSGRAYGFDLSYGLHWLDSADPVSATTSSWLVSTLPQAAATLLLPGWVGPVLGDPLRSEQIGVGGFFWIGPDLKLNFNYEHASGALSLLHSDPGGFFLPWETGRQDTVSVGLNYGRLQGMLIGRQVRPDDAFGGLGGRDALDLGFSWRMPWWNAALEFGARNLIVRPHEPSPELPKVEQGDLRVPYLRYHQEL